MRRILLFLILFTICNSPIFSEGKSVTYARAATPISYIATATNVTCTGSTLDFYLTITKNNIPLNVTDSGGFSYKDAGGILVGSHGGYGIMMNKTVSIMSVSCSDYSGKTLTVENPQYSYSPMLSLPPTNITFPSFSAAAAPTTIPTLGEWGLMILAIMILLIGLINIKQRSTVTSNR